MTEHSEKSNVDEPTIPDPPGHVRLLGGDYFTAEAIYELACKCAGIGTAWIMAEAPTVVMPSEQVVADVRRLLEDEYGIAAPEGYRT